MTTEDPRPAAEAQVEAPSPTFLADTRRHARAIARLVEELASCPTREIIFAVARDALKAELELPYAEVWSINERGQSGVVVPGAEVQAWYDASLPSEGVVQRALASEGVEIEASEDRPEGCVVKAAAAVEGADQVAAIPVLGREGTVRVVAVLTLGGSGGVLDEHREMLEAFGQIVTSAVLRVDETLVVMETNAANEALVRLFDAVREAFEPAELAQHALEVLLEHFGWTAGVFHHRDLADPGFAIVRSEGALPEPVAAQLQSRALAEGEGLAGQALAERGLRFVDRLSEAPLDPVGEAAHQAGLVSALAFPVVADGRVVGVFELFAAQQVYLTPSRRVALEAVAALVSQVFQRASDLRVQEANANQSAGLAEMLKALAEARNAPHACELAISVMQARFRIAFGSFWRWHEGGFRCEAVVGMDDARWRETLSARLCGAGAGLVGRAGAEEAVLRTRGALEAGDPLAPVAEEQALDTHFAIPIHADEGLVGVAVVHRMQGELSTEGDALAMESVRDLLTAAVRRVRRDRKVARYEPMVEKTPTALALADDSGRFVFVNATGKDLLRELSAHLPFPQDGFEGQPLSPLLDEVLAGKDPTDPTQLPVRGRLHLGPEVMLTTVSAITDDEGEFIGPMVSWDRVTDEVRRERELEERRRAEQRRQAQLQRGVAELLEVVEKARQGDLTCVVPDCGGGEISEVAAGLRALLDKLRASMSSIGALAGRLDQSASGLETVAERVNGNAASTLDNVNAASSAVREVTGGIHAVASGAGEMELSVDEIARHASEAASVGTSAAAVAKDAGAKIERLGKSSAQVGAVMRTINAIAEQTKLLALNATIEAARAGEAGRGFAVVANEVKNLARETAEATTDIAHRIEAIQGDTHEVVTAIERIGGVIESMTGMQSSIAGAVEEQTATTKEMSRSSSEARDALGDVARSTSGVVNMAEDTVSAARDALDAASDLRRTSSQLSETLAQFRY